MVRNSEKQKKGWATRPNLNTLNRIVIGENRTAFAAGTWNFFVTPRLVSFNLTGGINWSYDSSFGTDDSPGYVDIVAAGPNGSLYATEGDLFNQIPEAAFTLDGTGARTDNPTSSQAVTYVSSAGIGSSTWMGSNQTMTASLGSFDLGFGMPMLLQAGALPLPGITAFAGTQVVPVVSTYSNATPSGTEDRAAAPRQGLYTLSQADFSNSTCTVFLQGLANQAHTNLGNLIAEVHQTAGQAQAYVYDGEGSQAFLDQVKFPDTASTHFNTVGGMFDFYKGAGGTLEALSQFNGLAIFLRLGDWSTFMNGLFSSYVSSGKVNSYGMGTLTHEILHKKMISGGFTHPQMELALGISTLHGDCNGGLLNACSQAIGSRCFPSLK